MNLLSAVRCSDDHQQVLVVGDGAAQELHLEARLALEVEDPLALVAHVDQRLAHVVLRDDLAFLRRHAELEQPRTRLRRPSRARAPTPGLPSAGSWTFCDPMMRPSSSTSTVTVRPA